MNTRSILPGAILIVLFTSFSFFSLICKGQDARIPKPNFSELEKRSEVGTWTYDNTGYIYLNIKALNNPPQTNRVFVAKFYDQSALELYSYNLMGVGYSTPKGQEEHIEIYAPNATDMKKIKAIAVFLLNDDGKYIGPAIADIMKNTGTQETVIKDQAPPAKPTATNNASAGCSFTALPSMNANARYSETLAKSGIYELYGFQANTGGLSSPLAVGITFLSFHSDIPFSNTVTVVPGRGAQRKHDAAPVNATLYPFHTTYIVCQKYSNAVVRTQYENDYVLFKANNGNWQCGGNGVPKIIHLN